MSSAPIQRDSDAEFWDVKPRALLGGTGPGRPRVLFYVQDSWGLGHLQRVSKLARALQKDADCLIICGQREAGWIVPSDCEYVYLPSLNALLKERSEFLNKSHFMGLSQTEAIAFRQQLLQGVFESFKPHAFVVENRALGMLNELSGILETYKGARVLIMRGIQSNPTQVHRTMLTKETLAAIEDSYDVVLGALDRTVWDIADKYSLSKKIADKIEYTGYMSEPVSGDMIKAVRSERNLLEGEQWVVCSAGGGTLGEKLIEEARLLLNRFSNIAVDIIQGPRSRLGWQLHLFETQLDGKIVVHHENHALPLMHAAADLVISPGGYNSLTETMEGGAPFIALPAQLEREGEQYLQISQMAPYYPVTLTGSFEALTEAITAYLSDRKPKRSIRSTRALNFDGIENARVRILQLIKEKQNAFTLD